MSDILKINLIIKYLTPACSFCCYFRRQDLSETCSPVLEAKICPGVVYHLAEINCSSDPVEDIKFYDVFDTCRYL